MKLKDFLTVERAGEITRLVHTACERRDSENKNNEPKVGVSPAFFNVLVDSIEALGMDSGAVASVIYTQNALVGTPWQVENMTGMVSAIYDRCTTAQHMAHCTIADIVEFIEAVASRLQLPVMALYQALELHMRDVLGIAKDVSFDATVYERGVDWTKDPAKRTGGFDDEFTFVAGDTPESPERVYQGQPKGESIWTHEDDMETISDDQVYQIRNGRLFIRVRGVWTPVDVSEELLVELKNCGGFDTKDEALAYEETPAERLYGSYIQNYNNEVEGDEIEIE